MFTIKGVVYPDTIAKRIAQLRYAISLDNANATATAANFTCGSFVKFAVLIDRRTVADASFYSNGCGYLIAAADALAEYIKEKHLGDLHGLTDGDLHEQIQKSLGKFPLVRRDCAAVCIESLRSAFADYRTRQIEEFQGEKALICTCFGVSEETIESSIMKNSLKTVEQVIENCRAGGGCGSCRMIIQEMLDEQEVA